MQFRNPTPGLGERVQKAPPMFPIEHFAPAGASPDVHSSVAATLLVICTIPLIMLLRGLLGYLNVYLMGWVSFRAINDLRSRLFNHLLGLSSSFFSDTSTGTLMAYLNAASALQGLVSNSLVTVIKEPISVIGLVILLISQQPRLSLVALTILPFTMVPFVFYARKVRRASASMQQETTEQSKLIHESLTGYRIIKAYNLEEIVQKEFVNTTRASLGHAMRVLRRRRFRSVDGVFGRGCGHFFVYIALISR
jgi:ABC-type multidrug transport system fused ATPase/permease subunit